MSFKKEKVLQFFFQNRDKVMLILGITALLIGVIKALTPSLNTHPQAEIIPSPSSNSNKEPGHQSIVIDLSGAVIKPGVYSLPPGSRLKDALIAGGGLTKAADRDWIAKNINLAQPLTDGKKIYIPKIEDSPSQSSVLSAHNRQSAKINLNLATSQELETLPGIGPATAARIIEYRQNSGGFKSIEEIQSVTGIGAKMFAKIKDQITIY